MNVGFIYNSYDDVNFYHMTIVYQKHFIHDTSLVVPVVIYLFFQNMCNIRGVHFSALFLVKAYCIKLIDIHIFMLLNLIMFWLVCDHSQIKS